MEAEKTVISIKHPTPAWANWVFRSALLIGTTLNTTIVQAPRIPQDIKLDIIYWSGIFVAIIWGFSRIIGVKIEDIKTNTNDQH